MTDIVIASNNKHKIAEMREILKDKFLHIYSLQDKNIVCDPEENGETFLQNAEIKAREIAKYTDLPVLADDTGLCVPALQLRPGVHSARYAGDHDFAANRRKLLTELQDKTDRSAYFETAVVLRYPSGAEVHAVGRVEGVITKEERGANGFGYDSIFYSNDLQKTFAEVSEREKNLVSHRARALHALLKEIE